MNSVWRQSCSLKQMTSLSQHARWLGSGMNYAGFESPLVKEFILFSWNSRPAFYSIISRGTSSGIKKKPSVECWVGKWSHFVLKCIPNTQMSCLVIKELLNMKSVGIRNVAWYDSTQYEAPTYRYWMLLPSNSRHLYLWLLSFRKWYGS
jgi:hypothetical protein